MTTTANTGPVFAGPRTPLPIPAQVDVLIVGSGPNGATYARVLSEHHPRARILMVEAGPRLTTVPGLHTRNITDPDELRRTVVGSEGGDSTRSAEVGTHLRQERAGAVPAAGTFFVDRDAAARNDAGTLPAAALSSNVGGMGRHWACATPDPHPAELPRFVPREEWARVLDRGRRLLGANDGPLTTAAHWAECLRRVSATFDASLPADRRSGNMPVARRSTPDGSVHWSGSDTILGALATEPRDTFTIAAETLCTALHEEDGRVRAATLRSLVDGSTTTVAASVVVVAADSLRTPQLLWNSGIRPPALGRYLGDHLVIAGSFTPEYLDAPEDISEIFGAGRSLNNTTGTASNGLGTIPFNPDTHPLHSQFGQAAVQREGRPRPVGVTMFGYMLPKQARYEDRVRFRADKSDRYGMPAIEFDYSLTDRDHELADLATANVVRAAEVLGASDVTPVRQPHGMSLHYLGTVRMGAEDDGTSVCDSGSRVWGYDNLHVACNGVIPADLSCNPTLTSVAMSVRGAIAASAVLEAAMA
ncbi:GMC oxidoreductase [Umezawaea tangerina]|uniref:Pyranose oxidase n=1 Tax=Umezawaea tangerina TaxID=84725 RepID=A0A2T0SZU1_9PSEU|nr:GMC oxidoreductase [Umezawaea tangerina]PRY38930.1 pyranose oxidase [Umezawaea tangerina]